MNHKDFEFWYFLIEGTINEQTGAFANFYTYGKHCGEALDQSLTVAKNRGLKNPNLIETTRIDLFGSYEIPEEAIKINSFTYTIPTFLTYDIDQSDSVFIPPVGVAFKTVVPKPNYDLIKEYFTVRDITESGKYELEAVVDKANLIDTFFKSIELIPTIDTLRISVKGYWCDSETELWEKNININKGEIIEFLELNKASVIDNGYIDIILNANYGETVLKLDEHKVIKLQTYSQEILNNFIESLKKSGFNQSKGLFTIEDYNHWHYRTIESLNCGEFKIFLQNYDFDKPVEI